MAAIIHLVSDVVEFVNVSRNMTPQQVALTSEMIVAKYYYLTLDEIRKCFGMGCSGEYGQLYERLDGSILMDWLKQYANKRAMAAQRKRDEAVNQNMNEIFADPRVQLELQRANEIITARMKIQEQEPVPLAQQPAKPQIMVDIENEWSGLQKQTDESGIERINVRWYKGTAYHFQEFYNRRFEELTAATEQ